MSCVEMLGDAWKFFTKLLQNHSPAKKDEMASEPQITELWRNQINGSSVLLRRLQKANILSQTLNGIWENLGKADM